MKDVVLVIPNDKTKGLSHAIDAKLDADFKVQYGIEDVNLGSEWGSVFNIIQADQAEQEEGQRSFTDEDTDINNGSHYKVNAGNYIIKGGVWEQIVGIAKRVMKVDEKIQANQVTKTEKTADNTDSANNKAVDENVKTEVANILSADPSINLDDVDLNDVCEKYQSILAVYPNIEKDKISERITNYVKGLRFHNKEDEFGKLYKNNVERSDEKIENAKIKEAVKNKDTQASFEAYHKAAKEFIEVYDNATGNGKIQLYELLAREIKDKEKELGRKLTEEEKQIIKTRANQFVGLINQDKGQQVDEMTLDEDEIAAYLWAMSNINGDKSYADITYEEWKKAQDSMVYFHIGDDATEEQTLQAKIFMQAVKNGYEGLKKTH